MIQTLWTIDERLPTLSLLWRPAHLTNEDMDETEVDSLVEICQRAMPMKEFRKVSYTYDPDCSTDDIPF
jgi:hypothetical protein